MSDEQSVCMRRVTHELTCGKPAKYAVDGSKLCTECVADLVKKGFLEVDENQRYRWATLDG